ncbi:MAG: trehalase family glycosidase [Lentisphaerota bacterium]|jgi:putative isomerase
MAHTSAQHSARLQAFLAKDYHGMYREPGGEISLPFLTPGSAQYCDVLWDWDSWLTNVALRQILAATNDPAEREKLAGYEKGCIQNWLLYAKKHSGWIPIWINRSGNAAPADIYAQNMHKPCLAQHAAFIVQQEGGDAEWLREDLMYLQYFVNNYRNHHRHECGLYFWQNDCAIGVDNDPCTFGRPPRSSGSIYLNCLMVKELLAMAYLLDRVGLDEVAAQYRQDAEALREAVREHCWDERDGFYYSVDLNLTPVARQRSASHSGQPRDWPCLIQRIGVWSGFLALWAGIATPKQAKRMVREHYRNAATFNAPFGVRTLSKMEKMYNLRASGNPSSWLGPIWGISNYLTFRGLVTCGFEDDARELAQKTIALFGSDLEKTGALHEYYQPENGEPILNHGFQNWNYLVANMMCWLEGGTPVTEF